MTITTRLMARHPHYLISLLRDRATVRREQGIQPKLEMRGFVRNKDPGFKQQFTSWLSVMRANRQQWLLFGNVP